MNRKKIYQLLKNNGFNGAMIAKALNVTPPAVVDVVKNGKGSRRIASAIAEACDKPLEEIFPFYADKKAALELKNIKQKALEDKIAKFA